ncbi:oxidoreductase [Nocardioides psychrotolerans]|uniref:DMSO/TMAO reductase YedYZ, molybdopterin-dependent catalytic subunit n=1 Tax=Nocardioides psychrotolerans TaxID=1005945 RepID=A0A1I3BX72_9ACTN|nr:molybdopterin-dependent oxidoreductase [Nocardioides psychrotolerans]GEP36397.1 oxidoreductase [Nocardioides psychrotolerans]SFH66948.1 DMSO/TMAO reductase YedYZ, molybdopterin-dependent catalytic subunit [Nocardioides psychrotolerans]
MKTTRSAWALAGLLAGLAGLATSYFLAAALSIRESPVVAIAEGIVRLAPGAAVEQGIQTLGTNDKPILVAVILVVACALFAYVGLLARRSSWAPTLVYVVLAVLGGIAVLAPASSSTTDVVPVALGLVTWVVALSLLTEPLRAADRHAAASDEPAPSSPTGQTRRGFVLRAGLVAGAVGVLSLGGRFLGAGRRRVEETRRLLRLNGITEPDVPNAALVDIDGISPWMTPADDFYLIDTAFVKPAIDPKDWSIRIHGMVEQEIVLTYDQLMAREIDESWITICCVSNPVGGPLIGNAWWSGVRLASILAEAGVDPEADAVLQTSEDGWTCGTPIEALTDDRNAMLAVAMNGKPLPIEHGFPVRTIVPGLYGYVSATKWVVDMEVTKFSEFDAYWTTKGWGELGPIKMSSRVEVPGSGDRVDAGEVTFGGTAWAQHTGIAGIEVAVDGGEWLAGEVSSPGTDDTWVQWRAVVDVEPGDHTVRVRATDKTGLVQTGALADVLPDGATGWHTIDFTAS